MRVVEHWWNQSFSPLWRRDLRLQEDGGWSLWIRVGPNQDTFNYRSEADARRHLARLMAEKGDWIRLDEG